MPSQEGKQLPQNMCLPFYGGTQLETRRNTMVSGSLFWIRKSEQTLFIPDPESSDISYWSLLHLLSSQVHELVHLARCRNAL
jgi:hypothetical protein